MATTHSSEHRSNKRSSKRSAHQAKESRVTSLRKKAAERLAGPAQVVKEKLSGFLTDLNERLMSTSKKQEAQQNVLPEDSEMQTQTATESEQTATNTLPETDTGAAPAIKKVRAKKASSKKESVKADTKRKNKPAKDVETSGVIPMGIPMAEEKDPAHSPGHRKMNLKSEFKDKTGKKKKILKSAQERMSPADRINRNTAQIRMGGFVSSATRRGSRSSTNHR